MLQSPKVADYPYKEGYNRPNYSTHVLCLTCGWMTREEYEKADTEPYCPRCLERDGVHRYIREAPRASVEKRQEQLRRKREGVYT